MRNPPKGKEGPRGGWILGSSKINAQIRGETKREGQLKQIKQNGRKTIEITFYK